MIYSKFLHTIGVGIIIMLGACGGGEEENSQKMVFDPYCWSLPRHFPPPKAYPDNPITNPKLELGRYLFYDKRLSFNQTIACASCHLPSKAFSDGLPLSQGATQETLPRHSMALVNVVYNSVFDWANPTLLTPHTQVLTPMFNEFPVEMGWTGYETQILDRLKLTPLYPPIFEKAYPSERDPFTPSNVANALASFVSSLISANSAYDQGTVGESLLRHGDGSGGDGSGGDGSGDEFIIPPIVFDPQDETSCVTPRTLTYTPLNDAVRRGEELFFSERLECFHCHGGFNFSQSIRHQNTVIDDIEFHNNGLYNIGGTGDYPPNQQGLWEFTFRPQDMGRFRPPTLRNIALTAPYMHDGSIATLSEVIDHYARGGRLIESGAFQGDGALNPFRSDLIVEFTLTDDEKADLMAFLESLTDWEFICNPDFQDPFNQFALHPNCSHR